MNKINIKLSKSSKDKILNSMNSKIKISKKVFSKNQIKKLNKSQFNNVYKQDHNETIIQYKLRVFFLSLNNINDDNFTKFNTYAKCFSNMITIGVRYESKIEDFIYKKIKKHLHLVLNIIPDIPTFITSSSS